MFTFYLFDFCFLYEVCFYSSTCIITEITKLVNIILPASLSLSDECFDLQHAQGQFLCAVFYFQI